MGIANISGRLADRAWMDLRPLPKGCKRAGVVPLIAPDNCTLIDNILADSVVECFYRSGIVRNWLEENEYELLDFGGDERGITIMMLADFPEDLIRKLKYYDETGHRKRVTKSMASTIRDALDKAIELEPRA